jgi:Zn-dependent M28 family amino/carboxypeptidase
VGITLSIAERIRQEPLSHTTVNIVLTDCEETGAYGSIAYLDRHAVTLGSEAIYIILDEVGAGHLKIVTEDGLILKHKTHPRALQLARQAAEGLARRMVESSGSVYTDAVPATKRGLIALTISNTGSAGSHWHQMSDLIAFIDMRSLQDACTFTWNILQAVDQGSLNGL